MAKQHDDDLWRQLAIRARAYHSLEDPHFREHYAGTVAKHFADGGAPSSKRELSPIGLFSHAAEVATSLPQAKGSPQQMIAALRRAAVKPEELFNSGIANESATSAKRNAIEKEYAPKIEAAKQAMDSLDPASPEFKKALRLYNNTVSSMRSDMNNALVLHDDWASRPSVTREEISNHFKQSMPQIEEKALGVKNKDIEFTPEMERRLDELTEKRISSGLSEEEMTEKNKLFGIQQNAVHGYQSTKFGKYTLPGGENYREVLLRLEKQEKPKADVIYEKMMPYYKIPNGTLTPEFKALKTEYDALTQRTDFKSGHWDDPNVLAHIRMSDRTGPNGEKILHVEELQSDWAQKGRKQGFKNSSDNMQDLVKEYDGLTRQRRDMESVVRNGDDADPAVQDAIFRLSGINNAMDVLSNKMASVRSGVPSAPYVTNTQGWTDLALKRVLKEAAEGGYDKVVWTPGAEQAKRYDLSQHIDRIHHEANDDGTHEIEVFDPHGKKVLEHSGMDPEELESHFGKEVAEKIVAGHGQPMKDRPLRDWRVLSGLDLQTGGEGMKGYYDKIVPSRLQELVKRHDPNVKVGMTDVMLPPGSGTGHNNPPIQAPGIDITPQMRESILKGQSAFARGGMAKIHPAMSIPGVHIRTAEAGEPIFHGDE